MTQIKPEGETEPSVGQAPPPPPARIALRALRWSDPLRWLQLGLADFRRAPGIGIFYGSCFVAMGWMLLQVYAHAPAYVLALCAGFLLMGPFLCLGLYRTSQRLEAGEKPDLGDSLLAWDTRSGQLGIFGLVLLVLEMLWGRATLVLFALSFEGMPDFKGSLQALLDPANIGFTAAWLAVGAVFAGVIYALSVVSMPMIVHRRTDAITAALTSLRLVCTHSGIVLAWGLIIALLVLLAMLPGFAGLLLVGPVLGHASWHAYRAAVAD